MFNRLIYIYICVCVCVCVCGEYILLMSLSLGLEGTRFLLAVADKEVNLSLPMFVTVKFYFKTRLLSP